MRVRSAYLLQHSRLAVQRLPGLSHPPRSVDTLRSPGRGRHRPVYGTPLESSRTPSRCNRNLTGSQQRIRSHETPLRLLPALRRDKPLEWAHNAAATSPPELLAPFSACGIGDPLIAGDAPPATFRPQRFPRSRRLSPPETCRVCFNP
jgi:hypothetical protein